MPELTHVYFQTGSKCYTIGDSAFFWSEQNTESSKLKIVELPASEFTEDGMGVKNPITIGSYAFQSCINLETLGENFKYVTIIKDSAFSGNISRNEIYKNEFMKLQLDSLPTFLEQLGARAFYNCENVTFTSIPDGIEALENFVFVDCHKIDIRDFNNVTRIGLMAMYYAGNAMTTGEPRIDFRNVSIIEDMGLEQAYTYRGEKLTITHSDAITCDAIASALVGVKATIECISTHSA
jgi:hypothetical protein